MKIPKSKISLVVVLTSITAVAVVSSRNKPEVTAYIQTDSGNEVVVDVSNQVKFTKDGSTVIVRPISFVGKDGRTYILTPTDAKWTKK